MIHYEVNGGGRIAIKENVDLDAGEFSTNLEFTASNCAEDYHDSHDGWECSWPVDMVIYEYTDNEDGKELWRGSVDRYNMPHFSATTKVQK